MIKVLAVDDDKTASLVYEAIGERYAVDFLVVESGERAIAACQIVKVDVILMEWELAGDLDGFQTTGVLRELQKEQQRYVPIIAVTAHAMPGDRKKCLDAGMDDYLTKPHQPEALDQIIKKWSTRVLQFKRQSLE